MASEPKGLLGNDAPFADERLTKENVYYPRATVLLSVIFENFGTPDFPVTFSAVPNSVTVYSNSYKEADTWSVEFNAEDFPITPETIRSGAVEIYLYQTSGIGQPRLGAKQPDTQQSVAPELVTDIDQLDGLEPSIVGLFDEVSLEMSDSGKVVTIDGTDYTALMTTKKWPAKKRVPTGKRLDVTIDNLRKEIDGAKRMRVVVDPGSLSSSIPVVGKGESRTNRKGIPVADGKNYWDVMYETATRYGYIVFVRGRDIVLTRPQFYVKGRSRDRKMAWGANLSSIRMRRKMGKQTVPTVEVRSYDEKRRKTIKGRFPRDAKQVAVDGVGVKNDEIRVFRLPGITEQKILQEAAENYFNLVARSEMTVEIETSDLRDLEGSDLIQLRTGDAVTIGFTPFNKQSTLLENQDIDSRFLTLLDLGYDAEVAIEIAASFDGVDVFKRPFRVREATLEYSNEDGLHISAELQNFVNIKGLQQ